MDTQQQNFIEMYQLLKEYRCKLLSFRSGAAQFRAGVTVHRL